MKTSQRARLSSCCAALLLATVWQAAAGDGASFISETVATNAVMAPGQTFTQSWTVQNTGTTTWSPGVSGYTLNLAGTDSLGAMPLSARTSHGTYLPNATISSGSSVAPGATATFSMSFIAPEAVGTYADTLQVANASTVSFGPQMGVQIVVQRAGPTGQYDRAKAVSYANNRAGYYCSDGYFWTNGNYPDFGYAGTSGLTSVPSGIGDDCAHFLSCCIGSEPHVTGGGLSIPSRTSPTYGEPSAARLVQTVLLGGGLAVEVSSLSSLTPGDIIGWNWEGNTNLGNIDHDTIYLGNGVVAAHSASCLDVSATTWYQGSEPQWKWHLIHLLDKADTIPPSVATGGPTNGQSFTTSTITVTGTASDAGCPSSGVGLVQVQMNGTGGTWQTASGANNWSTSVSLHSGANTLYVRSRDGAGNYSTVASITVSYSPPPPSFGATACSGAGLQTTLGGLSAGETVVVEVSSDLQHWTPIQTNTVSGSTLCFTNAINPAVSSQFFRALVQ